MKSKVNKEYKTLSPLHARTTSIVLMIYMIIVTLFARHYIENKADALFLYNRAYQMYDCIIHGNVPFFYYNDNSGSGYGSPFFYGQLTLYPFIIFVPFGARVFLQAYGTVALVLNWLGAREISKRFTKEYELSALIYVTSAYMIFFFTYQALYANLLGVGISLFFVAKCIDFFRDSKSFIPASILFFVIINTHTISAFLAFIMCCIIMIFYFNKHRIKDYAEFAITTCLTCSYFILNLLYHTNSSIQEEQQITASYFGANTKGGAAFTAYNRTFLSFLESLMFVKIFKIDESNMNGFEMLSLIMTVAIIIVMVKSLKKFTIRQKALLTICILGIIVSSTHVWGLISNYIYNPIQFPRYIYFVVVAIAILTCIYIRNCGIANKIMTIAIYLCVFDVALSVFITNESPDNMQYLGYGWYYYDVTDKVENNQIVNGEYTQSNYITDIDVIEKYMSSVTDQNGNTYEYTVDNPYGSVTAYNIDNTDAEEGLKITFPKLYYKGYTAYDENGVEYEITDGYSQYCEVTIPLNTSIESLTIIYKHPIWLRILDLICLASTTILTIYSIRKSKKQIKKQVVK